MNEPDLAEFDFQLPDESIALRPAEPRDACRLLVVKGDQISDLVFRDIGSCLRPGDLLIGNDTRVLPALLFGKRLARDENSSTVDVQVNLLERFADGGWDCLCKPGRRFRVGDRIEFGASLSAIVKSKGDSGRVRLVFEQADEAFWSGLHEAGKMPIPPYIAKLRPSDDADHQDYQTVFARDEGSVAAPTAGLHFTDELISSLKAQGVGFDTVTLHVGAGTFAGLTQAQIDTGKLHSEYYEVRSETIAQIQETKAQGGRVIAIGTTAARTLESIADQLTSSEALAGTTDIFIKPGYRYQCVDALITNFHLPRSSLFMLVCALMGTETMQTAYRHAIETGYRFYSYGDACFLIPDHD